MQWKIVNGSANQQFFCEKVTNNWHKIVKQDEFNSHSNKLHRVRTCKIWSRILAKLFNILDMMKILQIQKYNFNVQMFVSEKNFCWGIMSFPSPSLFINRHSAWKEAHTEKIFIDSMKLGMKKVANFHFSLLHFIWYCQHETRFCGVFGTC